MLIFLFVLVSDLRNPNASEENRKHKLKRLVQAPNSYFMDVKCRNCYSINFFSQLFFFYFFFFITTVFSHAQSVIMCQGHKNLLMIIHIYGCSQVLCHPTGGKVAFQGDCSYRRKN
ncbi:hypothetical protein WA158_005226 [Blastocystis sp. Blastoise]